MVYDGGNKRSGGWGNRELRETEKVYGRGVGERGNWGKENGRRW